MSLTQRERQDIELAAELLAVYAIDTDTALRDAGGTGDLAMRAELLSWEVFGIGLLYTGEWRTREEMCSHLIGLAVMG